MRMLSESLRSAHFVWTVRSGAKDIPHEHPIHSMYFVTDVKLKIAGPPTPTKLGEEGGVAEVPAGAAPIFPAMAHQVENVGTEEGKAVFIEPYPGCKPCGDIEGLALHRRFISTSLSLHDLLITASLPLPLSSLTRPPRCPGYISPFDVSPGCYKILEQVDR